MLQGDDAVEVGIVELEHLFIGGGVGVADRASDDTEIDRGGVGRTAPGAGRGDACAVANAASSRRIGPAGGTGSGCSSC